MQPATPDPMNIQRRTLDIEDYIDVVRRHRAWIMGPMLLCLVVGTVTAFLWPDTYVSSAVVRVIPPQIPERFVPSNVNSEISQRINSMYQSITSRQTLTNIINVYQLYPRDRKRLPMEDVIEQMKKDIRLNLTGGDARGRVQAFEIAYSYENRLIAQKIVQELVSRFIDENIRTRAAQSSQTTEFLRERFEQNKRELDAAEEKLTKFRQENQGRMPEERQSNMAAINALDQRMNALNAQISRASQDKLLLESRLSTLKDQFSRLSVPEAAQQVEMAKNERLAQLEREILTMETNLEAVKQNYKETHPDVRRMKNNIDVLKRTRANLQKEEEAKKAASEKSATAPETTARKNNNLPKEARAMEAEIASIQSLIEARNLEAEGARKEIVGVERNMRSYQGRLEAVPMGTGQYEELLRERNTAALRYEEMQLKMIQSQAGTDLERRNQGETLELLDPASLPMTPTQPKRPLIVGASAFMGLIMGFVVAAVRELKDTTLKNLKDVRAYTQLMILGSVPLLENDLVVRRRRRLAWLAWSTACLAGVAVMAGSVFFYYSNKT